LSETERAAKTSLFARALAALGSPGAEVRAWWVPGRIEFLGKHTDYAGGPSLLCAVERGFAVVAAPRADSCVSIHDAMTGDRVDAALDVDLVVRQGHWSNYPLTVCRRIARNFPDARRGVDLAFASDLPPAAGLSSSSALVVGTFLALADANDLASYDEYERSIRRREDLASYLGAVENGAPFRELAGDHGVGTQGGSEDHTAILLARVDSLVQCAFAPIRFERAVPLPNDSHFVIAVSGVVAEKTGAARALYNRAAARAAEALQRWRTATESAAPTLAAALSDDPFAALSRFRDVLQHTPELLARVEQFVAECDIVRAASDALAGGDLARLGALVDQSQERATRSLGNQVPETIELARRARALGAIAASAFGAGFGGSVYALVRGADAEAFCDSWSDSYASAFPALRPKAMFFLTRAGPAAVAL
jgi:galactokinase